MKLTEENKLLVLPYVYKITHIKSKKFYIGCRYANYLPPIHDLGEIYFTSGVLKEHYSANKEEYSKEILEVCLTRAEAEDIEAKYIRANYFDIFNQNKSCYGLPNKSAIFNTKHIRKHYKDYIGKMVSAGFIERNSWDTKIKIDNRLKVYRNMAR